jgi:hypothetical protein
MSGIASVCADRSPPSGPHTLPRMTLSTAERLPAVIRDWTGDNLNHPYCLSARKALRLGDAFKREDFPDVSRLSFPPGMRGGRQAGVAQGGRGARAAGLEVRLYVFGFLPLPLRPVLMPCACPSFLAAHPSCRGKLCGAGEQWRAPRERPDTNRDNSTQPRERRGFAA